MTLEAFINRTNRLFVITGAGISTGSGIPDYRDQQGQWKRPQPMTLQNFTGSVQARRRYWARSLIGWPIVSTAKPNQAHYAVARLQSHGPAHFLVTQNVDSLHQKAGSPQVLDLHGRLDRVICLDCGKQVNRRLYQQTMESLNPSWAQRRAAVAPDGDAQLDETDFSDFEIPDCSHCGGVMKPDVVYFGETVPAGRISETLNALERSDAVLVVGSSLMVYSGFRFVRQAARMGLPIASVTLGQGRADDLLSLKVDLPCDEALKFLINREPIG
ncbi:MAG: NAD-dependent protein deacetylase [Burkholderiaceae bacterium]